MSDLFGEPAPPTAYSRQSSAGNSAYEMPEVDALLTRLRHVIDSARPMPLSASSMINKEEVVSLLDELTAKLPDELRAARWLLKERDEFLGKVRNEGDDILEAARSQSEQMVTRTEVVRSAEQRARQILEAADQDARKMRRDAEDYCDQKLGSFEIVLEKTLSIVGAGRAKLQGNPLADLRNDDPDDGLDPQGAPMGYPQAAPTGYPAADPQPVWSDAPGTAVNSDYFDPLTGQQPEVGEFFDQENM